MLNVTLRNTTHSALLRNVRGYFFSSTARWLKKLVFCSAHKEVRPATPHPNTHPPNSTREKLRYYLKMFTPNYWVFQIITHHNLTTTIYVMWVTEGSITRRAAHRCTTDRCLLVIFFETSRLFTMMWGKLDWTCRKGWRKAIHYLPHNGLNFVPARRHFSFIRSSVNVSTQQLLQLSHTDYWTIVLITSTDSKTDWQKIDV